MFGSRTFSIIQTALGSPTGSVGADRLWYAQRMARPQPSSSGELETGPASSPQRPRAASQAFIFAEYGSEGFAPVARPAFLPLPEEVEAFLPEARTAATEEEAALHR